MLDASHRRERASYLATDGAIFGSRSSRAVYKSSCRQIYKF